MSKKQETPKSNQGQRGRKRDIPFEELSKNEKKVVLALAEASEPILSIKELVKECGWSSLHASKANPEFKGNARGNSRVRNALRKLVKGRWVQHASRYGDGRYKLTPRASEELPRLKATKVARKLKKSSRARSRDESVQQSA